MRKKTNDPLPPMLSIGDLMNLRTPPPKKKYGPWLFIRNNFTLLLERRPWYEIDLEQFKTSAHMLDTIMQVAGKPWATPHVIGQLVLALDDLFDPQACLCSHGWHKKINPTAVLKRRLKE